MKGFFKKLFTGAGIGFLIGGPAGAILGAVFAGGMESSDKMFGSNVHEDKDRLIFISNLAILLTLVAEADGPMTGDEDKTIKDFFHIQFNFGEEELRELDAIMSETVVRKPSPFKVASTFTKVSTPEERLSLFRLIWKVASAGGSVGAKVENVIHQIADGLDLHRSSEYSIASEFAGSNGDPFKVLGVNRRASVGEIKAAYRTMAKQYHPDRVSHLGKEFTDLANEKFTLINRAYNEIRKRRRF